MGQQIESNTPAGSEENDLFKNALELTAGLAVVGAGFKGAGKMSRMLKGAHIPKAIAEEATEKVGTVIDDSILGRASKEASNGVRDRASANMAKYMNGAATKEEAANNIANDILNTEGTASNDMLNQEKSRVQDNIDRKRQRIGNLSNKGMPTPKSRNYRLSNGGNDVRSVSSTSLNSMKDHYEDVIRNNNEEMEALKHTQDPNYQLNAPAPPEEETATDTTDVTKPSRNWNLYSQKKTPLTNYRTIEEIEAQNKNVSADLNRITRELGVRNDMVNNNMKNYTKDIKNGLVSQIMNRL